MSGECRVERDMRSRVSVCKLGSEAAMWTTRRSLLGAAGFSCRVATQRKRWTHTGESSSGRQLDMASSCRCGM